MTVQTTYKQLLPAIHSVSGDFFAFQQDSGPSHLARETVALLSAETPDFISPQDWLPNSPDLNPVDYAIWGILQERVYRFQICDVDDLKERLIEEWRRFDQNIIDSEPVARSTVQMCPYKRGTLWTSDLNSLPVLTLIDCAGNSWLVSIVI